MAETDKASGRVSDDDLLANAIPIDADADAEEPVPVEEAAGSGPGAAASPPGLDLDASGQAPHHEIRQFTRREHGHAEDKWRRNPNPTGTGAVHCKTFVSKLRLDALEHMDEQINQWLDEHPQYEVKLVTATVGILTGKLREEALFVNVWV